MFVLKLHPLSINDADIQVHWLIFQSGAATTIGQTIAEISRFLSFQDGGHPPLWMCWSCIGTTHQEFLVVFIVVQNFIVIAAVVLEIKKF